MNQKQCLRCLKPFSAKLVGKFNEKKFCSFSCRTRYNAYKTYQKIKDTQKYKDAQRVRFNIWLNKNREHFNSLCRERNKLYQRRRVAEARANNLCSNCFKVPISLGHPLCEPCLARCRLWGKQARAGKKALKCAVVQTVKAVQTSTGNQGIKGEM